MNLSLNWFKSKKNEELTKLELEEQKLKVEILQRRISNDDQTKTEKLQRIFKSIKLVNKVLTVVFNDGTVIVRSNSTSNDFENVRKATNEAEIIDLCNKNDFPPEKLERENIKKIQKGLERIATIKDFQIEDDSVYLKGVNRSIPSLLVNKFSEVIGSISKTEDWEKNLENNEEYQGLKRFFMWCCLNPRAEVANELYGFLQKNSFRITKQGFFVALRNVVTVNGEDTTLTQFVSNTYNKIKAVWKKKPVDYEVCEQNGEHHIEKTKRTVSEHTGTWVGNLEALYENLPELKGNRFTDARTHTFDIRVGKVVNMPPEKCSWSTADCAEAGLHFTADEIHYVGCGDTSVLVLINPMKVVGIGTSKGRCYEYLPIMTVPREEATEILHDLDFDTLQLDEKYAIDELEGLAEKVKSGFAAEASKHTFNFPSISTEEIEDVVSYLKKIKEQFSDRISIID
jgi:hypothetical protein